MVSLFSVLLLFSALLGPIPTTSDHEIGFSDLSIGDDKLETYIVHVEHLDKESVMISSLEDLKAWHSSFLPPLHNNNNNNNDNNTSLLSARRIIYSYQHVMSGFAVKLTRAEAKSMHTKTGIISCRPEKILSLQTTRSPTFLGLYHHQSPPSRLWKKNNSSFGEGVIVGSIDTGAAISHPSFSDRGMPKPPRKWKGSCGFAGNPCNNKIIGGGIFGDGGRAVHEFLFDKSGHGTHTASTAAGNWVPGANIFGNAGGTAAGIAPLAHLAIYKLCGGGNGGACRESDFLAAFDAAIDDGVDVLSISLSFGPGIPFFDDVISVAAFRAVQKGIFVGCAAGNDGPHAATVSNGAPWILTVGASTIDRSIKGILHLGNGIRVEGESLVRFAERPSSSSSPLLYPGILSKNKSSALCDQGALKGMRGVRGGIVLCDDGGHVSRFDKAQEVKNAGGAVMLLANDLAKGYNILLDSTLALPVPTLVVSYADGLRIKDYMIHSCAKPTATVTFRGTILGINPAPSVAFFSSRGPNSVSPHILKPDVVGPGVNILAAWPTPPPPLTNTTAVAFDMFSGTSMATPHLVGVAALLKSCHPRWSPAAIKSAIMTSADVVNRQGDPITDQTHLAAHVFATGAGHVNPTKAMDPGLVYDMKASDYLPYLCGLGYDNTQVGIIVGRKVNCGGATPKVTGSDLNYPSFSIVLGERTLTYKRRVTNVGGGAPSCYQVVIEEPKGVRVHVDPPTLCFHKARRSVWYRVSFARANTKAHTIINGSFVQGSLKWVSPDHVVRSPISVNFI